VMNETAVLPNADLALCKDVMQHLPNDEVAALLALFKQRYRYALVTNDIHPDINRNGDIRHGEWRALRLDQPPFREQGPVVFRYHVRHGERHWIKDVRLVQGKASVAGLRDQRLPGTD